MVPDAQPTFPSVSKNFLFKHLGCKIQRSKWVQKRFYNALNRLLRNNNDLQTLNCGLVPTTGYQLDENVAPSILTRLGLELYHYTGSRSPVPLEGKQLLEIGCGRGGGTDFLARQFKPSVITGIDFSTESIRLCRKRYQRPNLRFQSGDATELPFPSSSFDVLISIETGHMVDDKHRLFSEAKRVLKPGGYFLYLDFIYSRPDSPHSVERMESAIAEVEFETKSTIRLTAQVFKALQAAAALREEIIARKCPRLLRPYIHEFCMTSQSNAYQAFANGRTQYLYYILRKPAE